MKNTPISARGIYRAIRCGVEQLQEDRNHLNQINVFPIPDGDTGTNLSMTLQTMTDQVVVEGRIDHLVAQLAEKALEGARGNSGMIFAQFVSGWDMQLEGKEVLYPRELVASLQMAVPYAYQSMVSPLEGTILTLIRSWVASLDHHLDHSDTLAEWFDAALIDAHKALEETVNQLPVLRKNGVVDAGAKGFVSFLEGLVAYLHGRRAKATNQPVAVPQLDVHEFESPLSFRYCTEGLIQAPVQDIQDIRGDLEVLGDSLIIAGNHHRTRVHIHTSRPEEVFHILHGRGKILQQKVDDMQRQMDVIKDPLAKVAIVTDSIADIPQDLMDKYQIHLLPMQITLGEVTYIDRVTLTADHFYTLNKDLKDHPTTSLPGLKQIESLLQFLLDHYEQVVVLSVAAKLSGTHQAICNVKDTLPGGDRVHVVDTMKNSGAQGLLVVQAAKAALAGESARAIVSQVEGLRDQTRILVSVETIKYAVRGGRVAKSLGFVGAMLNLKPIMSLDRQGQGIAFGKAFSYGQNLRKITQLAEKDHRRLGIDHYCIVHGDSREKAMDLAKRMKDITGREPAYIARISPVVGASAGAGAAAVSYITKGGNVYESSQ